MTGFAVSLFLLAVGAILTVAVTATVDGIDLNATGLVLMIVGGVGLLWSVIVWMGSNGNHRRYVVERDIDREPPL